MKQYGIIATWYMAYDGVTKAKNMLEASTNANQAIVEAIKDVENNPKYKSVGYGGLPNERGVVELDAAFMDGYTLGVGAIASAHDVKNPIEVAEKLSNETFNIFLVGNGADEYIQQEEFNKTNMLTKHAKAEYQKRVKEMNEHQLKAYDGHDTVSMVCLDQMKHMTAGTSTSGLFMKKPGRVGDSPIVGSGFYVDDEIGGCASTGVGEEIMKGVLSYEVIRLMKDGLTPQKACEKALFSFINKLEKRKGKAMAMSIIAMNNNGEWGVATNIEFTFTVATHDLNPTIFVSNLVDGKIVIEEVVDTSKWQKTEEHNL